MNLQKENGIGWCDFTANPVRGKCLHNCPNCYAESIRQRFNLPAEISYNPNWFDWKQFKKFRKDHDGIRPRIFVGSMHDLFGNWVLSVEIKKVIGQCQLYPDCVFQFLTQNPARYSEFEWPNNCWLGTTIRRPAELGRYDDLAKIKSSVKFISFEPLLQQTPVVIEKKYIDWVIVGCETGYNARPCRIEWMKGIVEQCKAAGVPVFVKQTPVWKVGQRCFNSAEEAKLIFGEKCIPKKVISKDMTDWTSSLIVREFPK